MSPLLFTIIAEVLTQSIVNDVSYQGVSLNGEMNKKVAAFADDTAIVCKDVKDFGERMVKDHSKANDELTQLASNNGVTLPKDLDSKHKKMVDRLSKLSGPQFDREYMDAMVKDHTKDVNEFQGESNRIKNPDLKNWTDNTLSTIKDHLQQAQNVAQGVTKSSANTK